MLHGRERDLARVTAGVLVLAAIIWIGTVTKGDPQLARAAQDGVVQQYPVGDRESVDDFVAQTLDERDFDSADLRGQVAVFNVWGSWCVPCRTEAPDLVRAAEKYAEDVQFVGINLRDSPDAARAFERRYAVRYPSVRSEDSSTAMLAFGSYLSAAAVPTTVIVDTEGRVAARILGPTTYSTLDAVLAEVLDETRQ